MQAPALITAEQFGSMPDDGPSELVRGVVVPVNPPKRPHGIIAVQIAAALFAFTKPRYLGEVVVESGCVTTRNPDSVRGPDVSFVRAERLTGVDPNAYYEGAPDIAVEIRSPGDTLASLFAKAAEYEAAGGEIVWIVDPIKSKVHVITRGLQRVELGVDDTIDGGAVLPGFTLAVSELFAQPS